MDVGFSFDVGRFTFDVRCSSFKTTSGLWAAEHHLIKIFMENNIVKTLVLTGYGLNCDNETAHAFELAGAKATRVHINSLVDGSVSLDDFKIMVFGGGFYWGDDHGAGVICAVRMKTNIGKNILEFID